MKLRNTLRLLCCRRGLHLTLPVLCSAFLWSQAHAQSTAPAPASSSTTTTATGSEDEIIQLSPFTVDASSDEGYRATNTLAGSRINTELKNVAAAITEITPQFLKDVAAVDINDVLTYTAGTESTHDFTNAPKSGIGGYDDTNASNPQTANRLRGLHSAQLMRDYFVTIGQDIGFDSYNTDRITINRGPNSVLFGLGDPSGSVNYSPKLAKTTVNSGEVAGRYGSYGDLRGTIDLNQVILKDKLAVRLAGLWSDRGFAQEPSYYKDNRGYLTLTYRPFEKTTIRASYERAKVKAHTPNTITPTDHVTPWINAGSPTWDPRTQLWSQRPAGFALNAGGTVGATGPDGKLENTFVDTNGGEIGFATYFQPNTPGVLIFSPLGVSNENFIDLHGTNLRAGRSERELDTWTVGVDQQIVKDLFLNVAFLKEDLDGEGIGGFRANQFGINVDVNTFLPDGRANPHFGELFVPQRSLDSFSQNENRNKAGRATLAYQLDFTRNDGWSRWLGKHSLTGFWEEREDDFISKGYNGTRTGNPSYLNATDKINAGDWQITYLRYLGAKADGTVQYPSGIPYELGATNVPHTYWNTTTGSFAQDTWGDYFARKRLDVGKNEISSRAAVWQGYFFKDRIVALAGVRRDEQKQGNASFTDRNPATGETDFPTNPFARPSTLAANQPWAFENMQPKHGTTKTYGVVVHPLDWLSLHYNKSETIQVFASGSLNLLGEPIGLPTGPGKDYGFSLNLMDGRLNAKVNWYQTDIKNARMPFLDPVVAGQWELPWFDQQVIPLIAARYNRTWTAADQFTPITYGDARVGETSDESAKGLEIEITYNPTKNWRIMANVTKQKAVQSNIAPGLSKWKEEVLPKWQAEPWWNGPIPGGPIVDPWGTSSNSLRDVLYAYNSGRALDTFKAFEGQSNPTIRKWRANFVNTYSFTEGPVKGFNVGGAVRWEDKAAIGYPAISQVINGTPTLVGIDIANAYRDNGNLNLDLWVGYTRRLGERYTWNIQLNARDVGRSDNLQPIVKNSDRTTAVYRIEFGTSWYLSSSLSW